MKQVFLAETVRPLYKLWFESFKFVRYRFGPFSEDVFERLDTLVFHGLVAVVSFERQQQRVEARYEITDRGFALLSSVEAAEILALTTDLVWVLQSIGVHRSSTICKLVYEEPVFAQLFLQHTREGIGPDARVPLPPVTEANNDTFATLALIEGLNGPRTGATHSGPPREALRVFIRSLAANAHRNS